MADADRDRTWRVALPAAAAIVLMSVAWPTAHVELGLGAATAMVAGLAAAAPVALAGVAPLSAWALCALGAALVTAAGLPAPSGLAVPSAHVVALLGLLLVVGVRAAPGFVAVAGVATAAVLALGVGPTSLYGVVVVMIAMVLVVAVLGRQLRGSRRALARSEERSAQERARTAVLEERTRIARELHDVVAHSMSMVVVRAETTRYRVPDVSADAAAELAAIADAARAALCDVRGVLGVLRSPEGREDVPDRPQPGPAEVDELLAAASDAGVDLSVTRSGTPDGDGGAATLSLHRILQEALTNAVRHAGGAPVAVELDHGDDAIRLRVVSGPGHPTTTRGSGLGLTGMRERAAAVGGSLEAGPTADGGFAVEAVLPAARRLVRSGPADSAP